MRRIAVLIVVAAVLCYAPNHYTVRVSVPPITPTVTTARTNATSPIPNGFLQFEPRAAVPLHQEGFAWNSTDQPDLPPLVDPCGTGLTPGPGSIPVPLAHRQVALVGPTLWKAERLIVYRDESQAAQALAAHRDALTTCARHNGTVWSWQSLALGSESLFLTGQRHANSRPAPGNYRGVVMRHHRTVVMYVDFGPRTAAATLHDVPSHLQDARAMAAKLTTQPWS